MFGKRIDAIAEIDGQPLSLVPTTKAHLESCLRWINDPEVCRFLQSRYAYTEEQEVEWLKTRAADPKTLTWSIELGDIHVGQADIHRLDHFQRTAITGIMIGKEYWKKGIATAVMKARAIYARDELNLIALYTEICIANEGSWRAAEKAGYVRYGQKPFAFFTNGQYYDAWLGCLKLVD